MILRIITPPFHFGVDYSRRNIALFVGRCGSNNKINGFCIAAEILKQNSATPQTATPPPGEGSICQTPNIFQAVGAALSPMLSSVILWPKHVNNFRYNPPCRSNRLGERADTSTAEGATPVTAQAQEPTGTGKSGERC
jgi:hypothetical protein